MNEERTPAAGSLAQTTLRMLGSSLKTVFAVNDETAQFDELLDALDRLGERRA